MSLEEGRGGNVTIYDLKTLESLSGLSVVI